MNFWREGNLLMFDRLLIRIWCFFLETVMSNISNPCNLLIVIVLTVSLHQSLITVIGPINKIKSYALLTKLPKMICTENEENV